MKGRPGKDACVCASVSRWVRAYVYMFVCREWKGMKGGILLRKVGRGKGGDGRERVIFL